MNKPIVNNKPFGDAEVNYPSLVAMKAITFSSESGSAFTTNSKSGISTEDENKAELISVLAKLNLKAFDWKKKNSNAGKYVSYSFAVTIVDSDQLGKLYSMLNALDVVKMLL